MLRGVVSLPLARAVGIGHRPEIATDLLMRRDLVGFCEIVAETCFSQRRARREAQALTEVWPVVPHGVKLSLGSADGIDPARARRLGALARELRAPVVSEHVAMTRGGAREIGHLTQLPRTLEAVRVVARNVDVARRHLPDVPLLLENVAWSFRWPEDALDEGTFYREIVDATGCSLLLDVGNLYANAVNEGLDPVRVLESYPLDAVAMVHVAGGVFADGFYFDTHADPIPGAVMDLVARVLRVMPDVPVLLERDGGFGDFGALAAEIEALSACRPSVRGERAPIPRHAASVRADDDASAAQLRARQCEVAALLTDVAPSRSPLARAIGEDALARARGILERKRVDDALPLLGNLAPHVPGLRSLAEDVMRRTARAPHGAGPRDALRIASAATERGGEIGEAALRDRLLLRARFARAGSEAEAGMRPRVAPFVGEETLASGTRLVAWKGVGAFAAVHLHERKTRSWTPPFRRSLNP